MTPRPGRRGGWWIGIGLATLAACAPPVRQFDMRGMVLSCDEANRLSYETLTAMGFTVGTVEPAALGHPGALHAARTDGGATPVTVRIECLPAGVNIDASEDGAVVGQIDFKRGFFIAFASVRSMATAQREVSAQMDAGTAPASLQRRDVQLVIEPLRGQRAKLDFPFDLVAGGVLPVRIEIHNLTARRYQLDPMAVRLTRADRERVPPLSPEDAAAQMADGLPRAATGLDRAAIAARLREHLFAATLIAPRGVARGFLYFPLADYTRARLVLTEEDSQETEGFVVEF